MGNEKGNKKGNGGTKTNRESESYNSEVFTCDASTSASEKSSNISRGKTKKHKKNEPTY